MRNAISQQEIYEKVHDYYNRIMAELPDNVRCTLILHVDNGPWGVKSTLPHVGWIPKMLRWFADAVEINSIRNN